MNRLRKRVKGYILFIRFLRVKREPADQTITDYS
nr:MAG TPA: hypothetical protein [Caudoviricetes sp.]DAJ58533.1 MAG TPA: hypothetical protein [Caudoviricetes sp.]